MGPENLCEYAFSMKGSLIGFVLKVTTSSVTILNHLKLIVKSMWYGMMRGSGKEPRRGLEAGR